jgi:hypothetical protein
LCSIYSSPVSSSASNSASRRRSKNFGVAFQQMRPPEPMYRMANPDASHSKSIRDNNFRLEEVPSFRPRSSHSTSTHSRNGCLILCFMEFSILVKKYRLLFWIIVVSDVVDRCKLLNNVSMGVTLSVKFNRLDTSNLNHPQIQMLAVRSIDRSLGQIVGFLASPQISAFRETLWPLNISIHGPGRA